MWGYNDKVWMRFREVLASDESSAYFLSCYMRHLLINRTYLEAAEIIDLQRYKVIKPSSRKMRQYVNEKLHEPFIFLCCNN